MLSSSDSEEDCYSNAAQKLEKLKNKYQDDKIESTNLLDDSADLNVKRISIEGTSDDVGIISDEEYQVDVELEKLIGTTSRRQTRASTRKSTSHSISMASMPATSVISKSSSTRSRGRKKNVNNTTVITVEDTNTPTRGRGRGSRGRGRIASNIAIYNVGNTEDYPDQSEEQTLFCPVSNNDDLILIDDSDIVDENEELSVKVYWRSFEYYPFTIRKFQKLSKIFKYFAQKENVCQDKLLFIYNDKILKPDDTPDSIHYNIAKFIDGGVISQDVTKLVNNHKKKCSGIKIKFQCQNLKKPFDIVVQPNEKFSVAMMKCAEHLEKPLNKLKFEFDGDCIAGTMTATELELEGGECIDVRITR